MVLRSTISRLLVVLIVSIFTAVADAAMEKPCCQITAIDGRTNPATARDLATGRVFQFVTPNAATTSALKAGQKIFANFSANTVSLDGVKSCCKIIPAVVSKPAVTSTQTPTAATSPQPTTTPS